MDFDIKVTCLGNFQQHMRKVHCVMSSLVTFSSSAIAGNSAKYSKRGFKNLREFKGSVGGTVRLLSKTHNILILTVNSPAYKQRPKNMILRILLWGGWILLQSQGKPVLFNRKKKKLGGFSLKSLMFFPSKLRGRNPVVCCRNSAVQADSSRCTTGQNRVHKDLMFVAFHRDPQHLLKFLQSYSNLFPKTHWPRQTVEF